MELLVQAKNHLLHNNYAKLVHCWFVDDEYIFPSLNGSGTVPINGIAGSRMSLMSFCCTICGFMRTKFSSTHKGYTCDSSIISSWLGRRMR